MYIFFFFIPVPFLDSSFSMNSGICQALSLSVGWGSLFFCSAEVLWSVWGVRQRDLLRSGWSSFPPSFIKYPRDVPGSGRLVINRGLWPHLSVWGRHWIPVSGCHSVTPAAFSVSVLWPPHLFSLWNACSLMFLSFHFSVRQLSFPSKDTIPMLIILQNSPDFFLSFKPKYQLLSFVFTIFT